jgi:MoaA/NifB/PqqE/SkfB family radical SAM enzyme
LNEEENYIQLFNRSISRFFKDALRVSLRDPAMALFLWRTIRQQRRAARVRLEWEERGLHVPPFMIVSVTSQCNLQCHGCYARAQHRSRDGEMSADRLRSVIAEAAEIGISIALIAGGEPLTRPEILDITADFPAVVFPLFTNGLLLDRETIERLKGQRNVVPVLSLEGREIDTDQRRGQGVYQYLATTMQMLNKEGVFFGTSLTVTRRNFDTVTDGQFIANMIAAGCKLFFFVEYVPVQPGTEDLILTDEQRAREILLLDSFRTRFPALFVAFPGDEEEFGGCLAAGRGFVHISPEGQVEPCPFSPFSDSSLRDLSLKDALQSRLLRTIRESGEHLSETRGGCALWAKRDWVRSLVQTGLDAGAEVSEAGQSPMPVRSAPAESALPVR